MVNQSGNIGRALVATAGGALARRWRGSATRRIAVRGPVPDRLEIKPEPIDPGRPEQAQMIFDGLYQFDGVGARAAEGDPWVIATPNENWAESLHGFGWLLDFRAADGPSRTDFSRNLTQKWLERCGKWHDIGWRPAVIGDRLTAWFMCGGMLLSNAELVYRSNLLRSMGEQARYVERSMRDEATPERRMRAALGAVYGGICLPQHKSMLAPGLKLLGEAVEEMMLDDGGVASRNPSDLVTLARRLVQLKRDLAMAGEPMPERLTLAIERIIPMIRFLRMPDGGLSLFNGSREEADGGIERLLAESGVTTPAPADPAESGFLRMTGGRTVVLVDAGAPPGGRWAQTAHAGTLSLEVSVGRRRMLVNCGSARHVNAEWEFVCRSGAAHSTLSVAESSPATFEKTGLASRLTGARRMTALPRILEREHAADAMGSWAMAAHDGFRTRFGLLHSRRLFLAADGSDLRGEDTLAVAEDGGEKALAAARAARKDPVGLPFEIRFHLHPDVTAEMDEDGESIMLALMNGDSWSMLHSGAELALESSIYLGRAGAPRPTQQIVLRGRVVDDAVQVKWAFRRLEALEPGARDLSELEQDEAEQNAAPEILDMPGAPFKE